MEETIKSYDESVGSMGSLPRQRRAEQSRRTNARVEDVCERLRVLAMDLGPGSRLPTIRELCGTLNTSSATLITALDLLENEQIFYREERQGIFVSQTLLKRSIHIVFNISMFSENAASPFWSLLWGHVAKIAEMRSKAKNEHISFHFLRRPRSQPIPEEHLSLLNSPSTDGCLVIGFNAHTHGDHRSLLKVPHVVFAGGGDWMVKYDERASGRLAAEVLLRQNCRSIAYWSALPHPIEDPFNQAYFFYQALQEQGFAVDRELFRSISGLSAPVRKPLTNQECGYLLAKEVYGSAYGKKPEGLYSSDDLLTDGALVAFEELGVRVGEDVHLVSLSNADSPILFGRSRNITLLEQDAEEVVRSMFALLESLMNGEQPREDSVYIQPRLREG
jgi:DNA-binding LacI/PurR family transcriptional regulator